MAKQTRKSKPGDPDYLSRSAGHWSYARSWVVVRRKLAEAVKRPKNSEDEVLSALVHATYAMATSKRWDRMTRKLARELCDDTETRAAFEALTRLTNDHTRIRAWIEERYYPAKPALTAEERVTARAVATRHRQTRAVAHTHAMLEKHQKALVREQAAVKRWTAKVRQAERAAARGAQPPNQGAKPSQGAPQEPPASPWPPGAGPRARALHRQTLAEAL